MGTRWMTTKEAPIHPNVKDAIVKATENDTILVLRKFRNTTRLHKNKVSMEVFEIENTKKNVEFRDVAHLMSGKRGKGVYETGDVDAGVCKYLSQDLVHQRVLATNWCTPGANNVQGA